MSWLAHTRIQPYQVLTARPAVVWSIGGSDSSGGAGIQADVQAINGLRQSNAMGAQACTIVTTITAQNSESVSDILALPIDMLDQQWLQLLADTPPAVIKISLLANTAQVDWLVERLMNWPEGLALPLVIYDPVAVASTGDALTAEPILSVVTERLLPLVDVLTPNSQEVLALTGIALLFSEDLQLASERFHALGVKTVLFKGGHTGQLMDLDVTEDHVLDAWSNGDCWRYCLSPKLSTEHGHGSGCSFASALASALAQGYAFEDSFAIAHAYVQHGLKLARPLGKGAGPVAHLGWPCRWQDFPRTANQLCELEYQAPLFAECPKHLGLYPVVSSPDLLERLLQLGVKTLQLRAKDLPESQAAPLVKKAIALGKQYQARVFINDYWQLALEYGAYGVHLGQEDLDKADLEKIAAAGIRIGISTHGYFELLRAAALRPSYLAIGHIYPTQTKQMPSSPQGLQKLSQQASLLACSDIAIPSVAIGGIDWERAQIVAKTDVGGIAVVRALTEADNLEQTTNQWLALVGAGDQV